LWTTIIKFYNNALFMSFFKTLYDLINKVKIRKLIFIYNKTAIENKLMNRRAIVGKNRSARY
jgi:hypothetical protein